MVNKPVTFDPEKLVREGILRKLTLEEFVWHQNMREPMPEDYENLKMLDFYLEPNHYDSPIISLIKPEYTPKGTLIYNSTGA